MNNTAGIFGETDHRVGQFFTQITPGSTYLFLLCIFLIRECYLWMNERWTAKDQESQDDNFKVEKQVDEEGKMSVAVQRDASSILSMKFIFQALEPFYCVLEPEQRKIIENEEDVCRKQLGMKRIEDESLDSLNGMHMAMKNLQGHYSYDLLFSEYYSEMFMYEPHDPDQKKEVSNRVVSRYTHSEMKHLTIDLVRCATDLAYMPRAWASNLEFNA